mmetsp:Transcript_81347/g.136164  ORF Transcript_81347/g.136164 Transcript_81347/m.136164 type:complete len:84 (+) Transcript_81347:1186-1437(+)
MTCETQLAPIPAASAENQGTSTNQQHTTSTRHRSQPMKRAVFARWRERQLVDNHPTPLGNRLLPHVSLKCSEGVQPDDGILKK